MYSEEVGVKRFKEVSVAKDREDVNQIKQFLHSGLLDASRDHLKKLCDRNIYGKCSDMVIESYLEEESLKSTLETLFELRAANNSTLRISTFDRVLQKCAIQDKLPEAIEVLKQHPKAHKAYPVNIFLKAVLASSENATNAIEVYKKLKKTNAICDIITFNTLLTGLRHSDFKSKQIAADLVSDLTLRGLIPDEVTYQNMISILVAHSEMTEAIQVWKRMKRLSITPTPSTYLLLLKGYVKKQNLSKSLEIVEEMESSGIRPNLRVTDLLLHLFASTGDETRITKILQKPSIELQSSSFHAIFAGFSKFHHDVDVDRYLSLMKTLGIAVDQSHKPGIIKLYCKAGKFGKALELASSSPSELHPSNFIPIVSHCAKEGNLSMAADMVKTLMDRGMIPSVPLFTVIIKASLKTHGNVSLQWLDIMKQKEIPRCREFYFRIFTFALSDVGADCAILWISYMLDDSIPLDNGFFMHFVAHVQEKQGKSNLESRRYVANLSVFSAFEPK